jgi:hypothetical protein
MAAERLLSNAMLAHYSTTAMRVGYIVSSGSPEQVTVCQPHRSQPGSQRNLGLLGSGWNPRDLRVWRHGGALLLVQWLDAGMGNLQVMLGEKKYP